MKKNNVVEKIRKALSGVKDPELDLPITELGLVYDIYMEEDKAVIRMTLTTLGCPLFDVIEEDIRKRMKKIKEVDKVRLELTFDPPWSPEMFTEDAKAMLGFI